MWNEKVSGDTREIHPGFFRFSARILKQFVGLNKEADKDGAYKPAWLHLDIAGPGMIKGHATGFGTLSVIEYLTNAPRGAAHAQDEA